MRVVGLGAAEVVKRLRLRGIVADEKFRGRHAAQFVEQRGGIGELGHPESAGGQVEVRKPVSALFIKCGGKIMIARGVEQARVGDGPGTKDLGDLALDQFARHDLAGLVAHGHPLARLDEFGDVVIRRVVRHAAHGRLVAFCQRDAQDRAGLLGVFKKKLVEISQPEEQHHIGGQPGAQALVLPHHRRTGRRRFGWRGWRGQGKKGSVCVCHRGRKAGGGARFVKK